MFDKNLGLPWTLINVKDCSKYFVYTYNIYLPNPLNIYLSNKFTGIQVKTITEGMITINVPITNVF